jgi:L-lactate dehydrogenase complex protein LldG
MKTEITRQELLARIHSRLDGNPSGPRTSTEFPDQAWPSQEEMVAQFVAALERASGRVYRAANAGEARERLIQVLRQSQAQRIVWAEGSSLSDLALDSLNGEFHMTCATDLGNSVRDVLAQTDVGITGADYAIAETGTLLLCAHPAMPRLLSALTTVHVAVVQVNQLFPTFAHLAPVVRKQAIAVSHMTLITGPSRTGDIEQVITIGAHGPRELHVILRAA